MFITGMQVNTPLGSGTIVGKESFYDGKLIHHLVRLNDPSLWAFGKETDIAAFFGRDITALAPKHTVKEMKMNTVSSENIKIGMGLNMWFGKHTIAGIYPYTGPLDFVINVIHFSNGTVMSNCAGQNYELVK